MYSKHLKLLALFPLSICLSYCSNDDSSEINTNEITDNSNVTSGPEINNPTTEPELEPEPEGPDAPGQNFDLSMWNLSVPIEEDGIATTISTSALINGYENSNYFFTGEDGAMVFKNFIDGPKTSEDINLTRSELREMIYGTQFDTQEGLDYKDLANNWVFSSSDTEVQNNAGAADGELTATVKIDHVTTTGTDPRQVGQVVIGQIQASLKGPCLLYYQKLADNSKGSIYFTYEPNIGGKQWHELIGKIGGFVSDPSDGIELDELFSYSILAKGNDLTVTIIREGKDDISKTIDMQRGGFANDWMYFKAGVFTQNNTGDADDFDQVSFYELNVTH